MVKVAVIDCKDSFVYNLVELLRHFSNCQFEVWDYTRLASDSEQTVLHAQFDGLLLSPGPGIPEEYPMLKNVIRQSEGKHSILGVCLGMQLVNWVYGGKLKQIVLPRHGSQDRLTLVKANSLLNGIGEADTIGRYHSWAVDANSLPEELEITALAQSDCEPMALRHKCEPFFAVQFHPESYLSTQRSLYISNWLQTVEVLKAKNERYGS